ncbi:DUF1003 domain-containing protein [Caulobacter sp. S45]|uniref:DUF1003 domain-containing protein n=1 Tax=Caulobacter sp. S45 TaxID=1641861 RepID=UPI0015762C79|nr:DUF1003 domain-containing protein [Caulobacter sp. S45]
MSDEPIDHVEANVQRMAELHAKHAGGVTFLQKVTLATTSRLGRASTVTITVALLLAWIVYNLAGTRFGLRVFDPRPFPLLSVGSSVVCLFTTLLILVTQRREEELARHRAQLTLHLVALAEQKIAKVIDLLEEQRRENPLLPSRDDHEARDMSQASDPDRVLDRIIETHELGDVG